MFAAPNRLNGEISDAALDLFCTSDSFLKVAYDVVPFVGMSLLHKKQHLGDMRYYERFTNLNDYKFELELARKHKFCYIAEPLAKY